MIALFTLFCALAASANAANCRCSWTPENVTALCPGQELDVGLNCTECDDILGMYNNGSTAAYDAEVALCKNALQDLHPNCSSSEFGPPQVAMFDGTFLKLEGCSNPAAASALGAGAIAGIAVGGVLVVVAIGVVLSSMKAAKAASANKYGTLKEGGSGQAYGSA